jgi:glycosyltransferase involved in cell wall biosynthesis
MPTPLFSIVVPTYNRGDLLGTSLQSVLDQTFGDFEIVVSDNHSADDTEDVVRSVKDGRVRYVRPAQHLKPVDHFEFVWRQAAGRLILLLGDDDALVATALEQYAQAAERFDADFLFCNVAEYRSSGFQGPLPNTVDCPPFTATTRVVEKDEYLRPIFDFQLTFVLHPTAYVFERALADRVVARTGGHFFKTNGIETFAWPLAAALARRLVFIDAPLGIMGRTHKSFGSNAALCNPGKKRIQEVTGDYGTTFDSAPLRTMAFPNLMCDGILGAKRAAPELFADYEFNEPSYLWATMNRLRNMRSIGIDVDDDVREVLEYARRFPGLEAALAREEPINRVSIMQRARTVLGDLGGRRVGARVRAFQQLQRLRRRRAEVVGTISGSSFGFDDILGCAKFLTPYVSSEADTRTERAG